MRPSAVNSLAGSGSTLVHHLGDQAQEVGPQPRHPGELGAVGHLVQRHPQPELAGWEGVALLQGQDVGAHVVDEVLVLGVLVLQDQQVVLAQHPGGHPPQDRTELGSRHLAGQAAAGPSMRSSSRFSTGRSMRW